MAGQPLLDAGPLRRGLDSARGREALDPLSPVISFNLGRHYYYTRDFARAIEHFQQALALDSHFFLAGQLLAVSHVENGAPDRAREQLRATPAPPGAFLGILSYVRAATGDRAGALQAVQTTPGRGCPPIRSCLRARHRVRQSGHEGCGVRAARSRRDGAFGDTWTT